VKPAVARFLGALSPASWVVVVLALASSAGIAFIRVPPARGIQFWTFATIHVPFYQSVVADWNRQHPDKRVELTLVNEDTLQQRMMSSFFSGTPIADVMEVERTIIGPAFSGPLDRVGFVDLNDRLKRQGLIGRINAPSFSPWTSRGHIFGIPHDVHPVLLAYRADLVESAGIDVSGIRTWDDYFRVMAPLMRPPGRANGAGRYLINGWPTDIFTAEMLLLQAGGTLFDRSDRPTLDSETNAHVIARLVGWYSGPGRVAHSIDYFTASGHQMMLEGLVVGVLVPDWYAGMIMKREMPDLAGKVKLMPLPAWEPGGRRTSAWGGTMLGITRSSPRQEAAWEFAGHLYLGRPMAEALFRGDGIISPNKANWDDPVYDQPDPYYCGQHVGRLFIGEAPEVPFRPSSPYSTQAINAFDNCLIRLTAYAERVGRWDPAFLMPEARRLLAGAQGEITASIARNRFLAGAP
jgi:arabinosaccharide transport system substrate-binding protein